MESMFSTLYNYIKGLYIYVKGRLTSVGNL